MPGVGSIHADVVSMQEKQKKCKMPLKKVDPSFRDIVKKINDKGYCTSESCSGTTKDHGGERHKFFLNGYISFDLQEISRSEELSMYKNFNGNPPLSIDQVTSVIDIEPTTLEKFRRLETVAKKSGLHTYIYISTNTNINPEPMLVFNVDPKETWEGIVLPEGEAMKRWNAFADEI